MDKREILCGRLLKVMMNKPYSAQTKAINKIGRQIKEYDDKYNIFTKTDKDIKVGECIYQKTFLNLRSQKMRFYTQIV